MAGTEKQYNIGWNNFQEHIVKSTKELWDDEEYSDVTLVSDDMFPTSAHRFILKNASPIFKQLLKINQTERPLLFLKGVGHKELKSVLEFLYTGETSVETNRIEEFIKASVDLDILELKHNLYVNDEKKEPEEDINETEPNPEDTNDHRKPGGKVEHISEILEQKNSKKTVVKCIKCSFITSERKELVQHAKEFHSKDVKREKFVENYDAITEYSRTKLNVMGSKDKIVLPIMCRKCKRSFRNNLARQKHDCSHREDYISAKSLPEPILISDNPTSPSKDSKDRISNQNQKEVLLTNETHDTEHITTESSIQRSSSDLSCDHCKETFSKDILYLRHMTSRACGR